MLVVGAILLADMNRYSLKELAKASSTSSYTIRHYVQRGLLHPAVRAGRSSRFDDSHLLALRVITSLRAAGHRGRDLAAKIPAEIARANAAASAPAPVVRRPTARDAVDAAVCAAAESLDISPRGLRVALEAVLRRLHDAGISPGEAAQLVGRAGTDV